MPAGRRAASRSACVDVSVQARFVLKRPAGSSCVCRLAFSPDSTYLLACTEEPHGNPFGNESCLEVWKTSSGLLVGRFPSSPFDVHASWIPLAQKAQKAQSGREANQQEGEYFVAGMGVTPRGHEPFGNGQPLPFGNGQHPMHPNPANPALGPDEPGGGGGGGGSLEVESVQRLAVWRLAPEAVAPPRPFALHPRDQGKTTRGQEASARAAEAAAEQPGGWWEDEDSVKSSDEEERFFDALGDHDAADAASPSAASPPASASASLPRSPHGAPPPLDAALGPEPTTPPPPLHLELGPQPLSAPPLLVRPREPWAVLEVGFLGVNFAHLTQVAPHTGAFLVFATGDNPWLVHQLVLVPGLDRLAREGGTRRVLAQPPRRDGATQPTQGGGGASGGASGVGVEWLGPGLECGGAVLSVRVASSWGNLDDLLLVNVRKFLDQDTATRRANSRFAAPEIDSKVTLQVWKLSFDESGCGSIRGTVALELEGHKAFTTKDCPFLLFTQQGGRPAGGHAHPAPPPPPPFESSPGLGSPSGGGGGERWRRRRRRRRRGWRARPRRPRRRPSGRRTCGSGSRRQPC
mmetsp:Transcript_4094/g.9738  ORF Transcript_4094/g.9738 Transcript_4094/m.9738 type:complete len:577 (+) Transcript_4094:282-2012(+)